MDTKEQVEKKAAEIIENLLANQNGSKNYYEKELLKYLMCYTFVVINDSEAMYAKEPAYLDPEQLTGSVSFIDPK
ncbi:hypothetical protein ASG65_01435 [Bacillus sp. Leaf13]|nr:hypothetical protein ASG65_01435 [Bacillus sp. Leaf13]